MFDAARVVHLFFPTFTVDHAICRVLLPLAACLPVVSERPEHKNVFYPDLFTISLLLICSSKIIFQGKGNNPVHGTTCNAGAVESLEQ